MVHRCSLALKYWQLHPGTRQHTHRREQNAHYARWGGRRTPSKHTPLETQPPGKQPNPIVCHARGGLPHFLITPPPLLTKKGRIWGDAFDGDQVYIL
jgi:hypothetical protein